MRSLAPLLAMLSLLPLAAGGTVDLADGHVTLGSVKLTPDTSAETRGGTYGPLAPDEKLAQGRAERTLAPAMRDATKPGYETVTKGPVVEIHVSDLALHIGAAQDGVGPRTYLLLPGSDILLPLTARHSAAPPGGIPQVASEPRALPPIGATLPAAAPAPAKRAPAPEPTAVDPAPVHAQAARSAAPEPRWAERAALAGAACAILLTPLALYHRLRGSNVLGHDSRAKLLDLLRSRPGISPADAARELGVDPSTALYHLRRLVKEGFATTHGERRGARYFAAGTVAAEDRLRVVVERESAGLLDEIRTTPGESKTALAQRLAIARATLHWHLGRLERAGLVRCERAGREVKVFPRQAPGRKSEG